MTHKPTETEALRYLALSKLVTRRGYSCLFLEVVNTRHFAFGLENEHVAGEHPECFSSSLSNRPQYKNVRGGVPQRKCFDGKELGGVDRKTIQNVRVGGIASVKMYVGGAP